MVYKNKAKDSNNVGLFLDPVFFLSCENDLTNMMGTLPKKQTKKIVPNDSNHYGVKSQANLETWIYFFIHTRILFSEIS